MKFNIRSFALSVLVLSGPVSAMADSDSLGLFVEPMATYGLGSTSTNYPSPLRGSSGNTDGFGIGARVGFHFSEVLFAGGDLRYSMPRFDDSSVSYNAKAVATNWALVVGMQMPTSRKLSGFFKFTGGWPAFCRLALCMYAVLHIHTHDVADQPVPEKRHELSTVEFAAL